MASSPSRQTARAAIVEGLSRLSERLCEPGGSGVQVTALCRLELTRQGAGKAADCPTFGVARGLLSLRADALPPLQTLGSDWRNTLTHAWIIAVVPTVLLGCGGSNSLSGPLAFNAVWSAFSLESPPGLSYEGVFVTLTDTDLTNRCGNPDAGTPPPFKEVLFNVISGTTSPISSGDFPIMFPGPADVSPSSRYVVLAVGDYSPKYSTTRLFSFNPVAVAVSGNVSLTMVSTEHVTGSFNVMMEALDGGPQTPLSGTFSAGVCAGS
jgi:hypothetical protein